MPAINWTDISKNDKLSEDLIRQFKDFIDWDLISRYQVLSETFILEFKENVNWHSISAYQTLSESFITANEDYIKWDIISRYQKLSERFIINNLSKLDMDKISEYQTLSDRFILNHYDKLNMKLITKHQGNNMSEDTINELKDVIDWEELIKINKNLSEAFINLHYSQLDWCDPDLIKKVSREFLDRNYKRIQLSIEVKICEKLDNLLKILSDKI